MEKEEYLKLERVKEFVKWISLKLDGDFIHEYIINTSNRSWIVKNESTKWTCNSIYDAHVKYFWADKDFSETQSELENYRKSISSALEQKNSEEILKACYDILKWGGQRVFTPNYPKLEKEPDLYTYLNDTIEKLNPDSFNDDIRLVGLNGVKRFNAGMTKVYSLCINNFPIYDSRVAIALTNLISQFLIDNKIKEIPESLHFKIPKGGNDKTRPNRINGYGFGYLYYNSAGLINYQISNVRASWLFEEILNKSLKSKFNLLDDNERMRAFESALFMIGYSI
jgi:hypothetical protein